MAIASMLGVALFTILSQSLKSMQYVEAVSAADRALMGLYQRLEKDIIGMTIPLYGDPAKKPEDEKDKKRESKSAQEPKKVDPSKNKPKESYLENYIVLEQENKLIKKFSFITTNPFMFYGESLPWLVRVMYTLKDQGHGRYALQRAQSISFDNASAGQYTVCEDLISLQVLLTFASVEKENESDKDDSAGESFTYKKYEKFPVEDEEFDYPLPITVTVEGIYFDVVSSREHSFSYSWHIPTWYAPIKPVPVSNYKIVKKNKQSAAENGVDGSHERS
jgi:hypothetical protein